MSENNRSELIDHAKLCYELKRWEDTVDCMKKVIKMGKPLNYEERKLLFNAFTLKTDTLSDTLASFRSHSQGNILVKNLTEKVAQEIIIHCDNAIEVLDDDLIKNDENVESIAHYKCGKVSQHYYKVLFMSDENKDIEVKKTHKTF